MAVTQTIQDQVTELYVGFFGRAPDAVGMGYWAEKLGAGTATVYSIANEFSKTPEFISNYGGLTPTQQVTRIYQNVLDRAPDAGGLAYWVGELAAGVPIGSVVYNVVNAAFSQVGTADGLLVQNKVTVGEYFALTLASNDTAVAKTAYNGVTSVASSVVAAEAALAQAVAPTYTLTTSIETVPAQGTLPAYANVNGVVNAAGSTFQTGDTINGTVNANNQVVITDAGNNAAGTTATVTNVAAIKHNLLASNVYNEALYSGVGEEFITNSTGTVAVPVALTLNNAQLATVFGAKDSTAGSTTLNVGIRASDLTGTANTLNLSVRNAGSTIVQAGAAPVSNQVTINSTSTGIEAIAIATSGVNNIVVTDTPAAGVPTDYAKTTVTGDGANTIDVSALTQNLTYDLSGATGANTLQFGAALQSNTVITGGSAADVVRVNQGTVVAGLSLTNVETLRSSVGGSTGTIAFTTSSLTTLRIDGDAAEAGRLTLVAPGSVATINYIGDGLAAGAAGAETFKALTITGAYAGASDAVTVTLSNAGTTNLAGYTVNFGAAAGAAILANGIETLTVNATQVGAGATTTFTNGIASSTLQSATFTTTGAVQAGVLNAAPAAGNSALTMVDFSGVMGTAASAVSFDGTESVGAATQVKGAGGTGNFTLTTGIQGAAGTQADTLLITGGNSALTTINAQAAGGDRDAFSGTLSYTSATGGVANTLNVGDLSAVDATTASTTVATFSGAGSVNIITGGVGVDTITLNASGLGSANTVNGAGGADVINASASTVNTTLNGGTGADVVTAGAAADTISYAVGDGAAATAIVFAGTVANTFTNGDTITVTTDIVNSFTAAADFVDVAAALAGNFAYATVGVTAVNALANNTLTAVRGTYNAAGTTFTVNAAGADAFVVANTTGGAASAAAVGGGTVYAAGTELVLIGVGGTLTAANFI